MSMCCTVQRAMAALFFCWLVAELEFEASLEKPSQLSMADPDVQFCVYMINRHGDNYEVRIQQYVVNCEAVFVPLSTDCSW